MHRDAEERLATLGNDVPPIPDSVMKAARDGGSRLEAARSRKLRHRAAGAGAISLALLAASFTPPGRAATGWVADLAGVGDEPSLEQVGSVKGSEVVVASGTLSDGTPYEAVIKRVTAESTGREPGEIPNLVCLQVDWPAFQGKTGGGNCIQGEAKSGLDESWAHHFEAPDGEYGSPLLFLGFVGNDEVASVRVEQTSPTEVPIESELIPLDGEIQEQVGSDAASGVFITELSGEIVAGGEENAAVIVATALNDEGAEMGSATIEGPFYCPLNFEKPPPPPPAGSAPATPVEPGRGEIPEFECGETLPKGPPPITQFRLSEEPVPADLLAAAQDLGSDLEPADAEARAPLYDAESGLVSVDDAAHKVMNQAGETIVTEEGGGSLAFGLKIYAVTEVGDERLVYALKYTAQRYTGPGAPSPEEAGFPREFLGLVSPETGEMIAFGELD